jgi:hypothetical protein
MNTLHIHVQLYKDGELMGGEYLHLKLQYNISNSMKIIIILYNTFVWLIYNSIWLSSGHTHTTVVAKPINWF